MLFPQEQIDFHVLRLLCRIVRYGHFLMLVGRDNATITQLRSAMNIKCQKCTGAKFNRLCEKRHSLVKLLAFRGHWNDICQDLPKMLVFPTEQMFPRKISMIREQFGAGYWVAWHRKNFNCFVRCQFTWGWPKTHYCGNLVVRHNLWNLGFIFYLWRKKDRFPCLGEVYTLSKSGRKLVLFVLLESLAKYCFTCRKSYRN